MSVEVKPFYASDHETDYANGKRGLILVVPAYAYNTLKEELESFTRSVMEREAQLVAERDALKEALESSASALEYISRLATDITDYSKTKCTAARQEKA